MFNIGCNAQLVDSNRFGLCKLPRLVTRYVTCVTSLVLAPLISVLAWSLFSVPAIYAGTAIDFGQLENLVVQHSMSPLSERVLVRLAEAESRESDPSLKQDIRQSWIVVSLAERGEPSPFVESSYRCYGCHPDQLWPRILARRQAQLGKEFSQWWDQHGNLRVPLESHEPQGLALPSVGPRNDEQLLDPVPARRVQGGDQPERTQEVEALAKACGSVEGHAGRSLENRVTEPPRERTHGDMAPSVEIASSQVGGKRFTDTPPSQISSSDPQIALPSPKKPSQSVIRDSKEGIA